MIKIGKQSLTEWLPTAHRSKKFLVFILIINQSLINTIKLYVRKKLHTFIRVIKYMSTNQAQMLMRSFIMPQFSCCPLIWTCHIRKINNQINKSHERALRLVYKKKQSSRGVLQKRCS